MKVVGSAHTVLAQMAKDAELLKERAERIRALRAMARVSQETAAQNIGVSVRGYAEWEAGRGGINDENLKALALYYGTTPDYIEYGVMKRDTPDPFSSTIEARLDKIEEKLDKLLGQRARAAERLAQVTPEDAADALEMLTELRRLAAQAGRDVGRRDVQARRARDRQAGRSQAAS